MKKFKFEYFVLIVIVIFSLLYLVFKKSDRVNYSLPELNKIEASDINRVEIKKENKIIVLSKRDDSWKIGEKLYQAETSVIDKILKDISTLNLVTLVSKRKNFTLYDLNESRKIEVKAFSGKELLRAFEIGKVASTYDHTYVKISDDTNVYQAEGSIRDDFDKNIDDLRDKTVLKINKNSITSLKIGKGVKEFLITKIPLKNVNKEETKEKLNKEKSYEWKLNGKKLDSDKIEALLNRFVSLDCSSFIYDKDEIVNVTPLFTVEIIADKKYFLKIYDRKEKDKGEYPAISSDIKYPFFLNAYTAEEIMKNPEDFIVK